MNFKDSILNLGLRGLSMGARFLLILYLGKFFSLDDLGFYGIFFSTVTLSFFLLGLDFYGYSNRETLYARVEDRLSVLRAQLIFYLVTYAVFLLPLSLIFFYDVLPFEYIVFFYVILILEHLSQELYRIFTMLSYPIFANWLLFLRSGIWVYLIILGWTILPNNTYSMSVILWGWAIGAGVSVIIGFIKIFQLHKGYELKSMDLKWFIDGIKISALYFSSTIALKIIEFSSRYMLEYWGSLREVGIFTFYNQIANMINVVIFTLFIMVVYPKLVLLVNQNNIRELLQVKRNMMNKILIYSSSLAILLIIIIKPILYLINKSDFFDEINTFYILILSNIILNVSLVYHYVLYAFRKDFSLFISTAIGAAANILLNIILIQGFGLIGAAVAALLSYIILALLKGVSSRKARAHFLQTTPQPIDPI